MTASGPPWRRRSAWLIPGALALGLQALAAPGWVEAYWRAVYPWLDRPQAWLAARLPVSPTELGLAVLGLALAAWPVRLWRRRRRGAPLRPWLADEAARAAGVAGLIALWFVAGWGLTYHRAPIEQRWDLALATVDEARVQRLAGRAVAQANASRPAVVAGSLDGERERLADRVRAVALRRDGHAPPVTATARIPLAWRLLELAGVDGVTSPFGHEVLLNATLQPPVRAATLAHELAHNAGYAREGDASLVGLLACWDSPVAGDRYAAALDLLGRLWATELADGRRAWDHLDAGVQADLKAEWARLRRRRGAINRLQSRVNDLYLRSAGDPDGTASYGRVVRLMAAALR